MWSKLGQLGQVLDRANRITYARVNQVTYVRVRTGHRVIKSDLVSVVLVKFIVLVFKHFWKTKKVLWFKKNIY